MEFNALVWLRIIAPQPRGRAQTHEGSTGHDIFFATPFVRLFKYN